MAIVEMTIDSVRHDWHYEWVVILKEMLAERYLSIYMGSSQADIIKSLLTGTKPAELVDYDFSINGVDTTNAVLKSVLIDGFKDNIFYAKLLITHHNKSYKVGCPVAKAIALAVKIGMPIFVEEKILNKAAINVPAKHEA